MLKRFSHVMMYVTDLERAVRFYEEKLGFRARFVAPGAYASLAHGESGQRLDLHPTEAGGKDVGHGPIPYFLVADIDAAAAALKDRGITVGEIRREGESPRFATFWDSEGNAVGIEEGA